MTDVQEKTATHLLKKEVDRFLSCKSPEVLCIRGKWGVGKTYGWNNFLLQAKASNAIALNKYAYVSLFGIQSLDELKYSIFENTVGSQDIGTEPTTENLTVNTGAVLRQIGRHSLGNVVNYIPFVKNPSDTLKVISFLRVRDQIVCIDDLERKGKNLRTQDVLGLISFLRERRGCKVVLILNDEELEPEDREQLEKYQEKVIDASLLFAPNEEDCVEIALPNSTGPLKLLAERTISLGISNIRIIKKVERLVLQISGKLREFDPAVLNQAVQSLTLFGWAYFGKIAENGFSFLDYVLRARGLGTEGDSDQVKKTKKDWDEILDLYGFTDADDFDLALLDGVRRGFFDEDRVARLAQSLHERHVAEKSSMSVNSAWARFHSSFDDDAELVISELTSAIKTHVSYVTPATLNSYMRLMIDLGRTQLAASMLAFYMVQRGDEDRSFYDLENHPFYNEQYTDPDLRKAFADKLANFAVSVDAVEILTRIQKHQGWSNKDIAHLSSLSVADYKTMFKSLTGIEMRTVVRAAVGFENISNRGTEYDAIINNAKQALREIANESLMNKCRVERLIGPPPAIPENAIVDDGSGNA
jgi:hypothetical protein